MSYYSSHCIEEWHLASIALFVFCIISVPVELKLLHPLDKERGGGSHDLNDTSFKSYVHNSKG